MPDWLPPFLAAALTILLLNLALLEQRRRAHRRSWNGRLLRELRAWDGRLPDELDRLGGELAEANLHWLVYQCLGKLLAATYMLRTRPNAAAMQKP